MQLGILTPRVADVDTAHGSSRGPRRAQMARAQRSGTALRSAGPGQHLLVSERGARVDAAGRGPSRTPARRPVVTALAPLLQAFFTERLIAQRRASGRTIAYYRNTFRLLLGFATAKTGTKPSALDIADLDAPLITAFLDHLEHDRHNTVRTRNWRLAAIHSMFGYATLHHPEHAAVIQRVLAIPAKRYQRT